MPITYSLYNLVRFPSPPEVGEVLFSRTDGELRGTPATLVVKYIGNDEDVGLEQYTSVHEMHRRIAGRTYTGETFESFFQQNETKITLMKKSNLCLCRSGRRAAKSLVDRLNSEFPITVRLDYIEFDFDRIRERVDEVNGIWVSGIGQPNIDTVAMFGMNVDQSDVYEALKSLGSASSILLPFTGKAGKHPVILSMKGSVTFMQPLPEEQCLDILFEMKTSLLGDAMRVVESKQTTKERKTIERTMRTKKLGAPTEPS